MVAPRPATQQVSSFMGWGPSPPTPAPAPTLTQYPNLLVGRPLGQSPQALVNKQTVESNSTNLAREFFISVLLCPSAIPPKDLARPAFQNQAAELRHLIKRGSTENWTRTRRKLRSAKLMESTGGIGSSARAVDFLILCEIEFGGAGRAGFLQAGNSAEKGRKLLAGSSSRERNDQVPD